MLGFMAAIPSHMHATGADCDLTGLPDFSTIVMKYDPFAAETGLYTIEGCDGASPTLHLNKGYTYNFDQSEGTNWYHPVGFSYEPGGAHNDCFDGSGECPELGGEEAGSTLQYYMNGTAQTDDESGFGLDAIEPLFFHPYGDWQGYGPFSVHVTVPDVQWFYYFCHIHAKMSALIMVVDHSADAPAPAYHDLYFVQENAALPTRGHYDMECGTTGLDQAMSTMSSTCDGKHFLCGDMHTGGETFNECMEGIDCKMHHEMAVHTDADPIKTFMRQMIPHHQNAVAMSKILLKQAMEGNAPGVYEQNDEGAQEVHELLMNIINTQNSQIQFMQGYLEGSDTHYCYDDPCAEYCAHHGSRRNRHLLFGAHPNNPHGCHCHD
jgi:uncharacterized protein (DUF305 family)